MICTVVCLLKVAYQSFDGLRFRRPQIRPCPVEQRKDRHCVFEIATQRGQLAPKQKIEVGFMGSKPALEGSQKSNTIPLVDSRRINGKTFCAEYSVQSANQSHGLAP